MEKVGLKAKNKKKSDRIETTYQILIFSYSQYKDRWNTNSDILDFSLRNKKYSKKTKTKIKNKASHIPKKTSKILNVNALFNKKSKKHTKTNSLIQVHTHTHSHTHSLTHSLTLAYI